MYKSTMREEDFLAMLEPLREHLEEAVKARGSLHPSCGFSLELLHHRARFSTCQRP